MNLQQAAEAIVKSLVDNYGDYSATKPVIRHKSIGDGDDGLYISWEEGPDNWTQNDPLSYHQEVASEIAAEFGATAVKQYKASDYKPFFVVPAGFEAQPWSSITLVLYKV